MYGLAGPRYGAWSLLDQQQPSAIGIATQTGQGLANLSQTFDRNNLMSQMYSQNQQMQPGLLQAQQYKNSILGNTINYQNQTMPGLIASTNATNAANAQYDPLKAQAEYQGLVDSNNNTTARTGLLRAQTGQLNQPSDPSNGFNALYSAYQQAPVGGIQKQIYAGMLNKWIATNPGSYMPQSGSGISQGVPGGAVGAAGVVTSPSSIGGLTLPFDSSNSNNSVISATGGGSPTSNASPSVSGGSNQVYVDPGSTGSRSNKGRKTAVVNPDGTTAVYTSATNGANTQIQNRTAAEAELGVYNAGLQPNLQAYSGSTYPTLKLLQDRFDYSLGLPGTEPVTDANGNSVMDATGNPVTTTAKQRLQGLLLANRLLPEASTVTARMAKGSDPGEKAVADIQSHAYPNIPNLVGLLAPGALNKGLDPIYNQIQQNAVDAAKQQNAYGYPTLVHGIPQWVQAQNSVNNLFTGDPTRDAANFAALTNSASQTPQQNTPNSQAGGQSPANPNSIDMAEVRAEQARRAAMKGGK